MTDPDDVLVGGEFAAFRAAYAPVVQPAGTAAVRRTVRRRRRRAVVLTAGAVVLAVAIPVGASGALHRRGGPPPEPALTAEPTPSASDPSPSPPAVSASPSATSPTPAAPDGRISRAQLLAGDVDLVAWVGAWMPKTCTSRDVRLDPGPNPITKSVPVLLGDPAYGDIDGDGATETVALVGCRYGEASAKQLLAFDRDRAGQVVTLGRVVGTHEGMDDITDFSVRADGTVRAYVADIQPCCDTPMWKPRHQWRTFTWAGAKFTQTAGPTAFGPDTRSTDLTLRLGEVVLTTPDASGDRIATVTATVTNRGPVDVPRLGFSGFRLYDVGGPAGGVLERCREVPSDSSGACVLDGLAAGARRTYTFSFHYTPAPDGDAALRVIHYDAQDHWWDDLKPKDNSARLRPAQ
ncbi:hypothetical protein O7602_02030 [Micromonospora sp. WMMD1128]|uniref:hypothetical protein n=1 Tax=Micromonospora sp. WMMD1128 TaxID=3015150 RepID=UPI00248B26E1|nr:hypothetical protein [Micromonospora sp. WMMD1128]WBB74363.1 hypothetical protein O7602_02030 [Micromonospora sp. WMMD1128]